MLVVLVLVLLDRKPIIELLEITTTLSTHQ